MPALSDQAETDDVVVFQIVRLEQARRLGRDLAISTFDIRHLRLGIRPLSAPPDLCTSA